MTPVLLFRTETFLYSQLVLVVFLYGFFHFVCFPKVLISEQIMVKITFTLIWLFYGIWPVICSFPGLYFWLPYFHRLALPVSSCVTYYHTTIVGSFSRPNFVLVQNHSSLYDRSVRFPGRLTWFLKWFILGGCHYCDLDGVRSIALRTFCFGLFLQQVLLIPFLHICRAGNWFSGRCALLAIVRVDLISFVK